MKKIAFFVAFTLATVAAAAQTLPAKAQKFIEVAFPERSVLMVKEGHVDYEVMLDDFTELEFDSRGNWKEIDAKGHGDIPDAAVPAKILERIAKNFDAQKIVKIERNRHSNYEVELINGIEIEFNNDFVIIDIDK